MGHKIKITKGLDIGLSGEADKYITKVNPSDIISISPDDFYGIVPKLCIKKGDEVRVGDAVMYSKHNPEIKLVTPASGEVIEIVRGEKRKILEVRVLTDNKFVYKEFPKFDYNDSTIDELKSILLESGCWGFIKQRPFDVIANPKDTPRDIFISGFDSKPNAPDLDFTLDSRVSQTRTALEVLKKMTSGKVYISLRDYNSPLYGIEGIEYIIVKGPHPAGNVGVQIHHISPINKNDIIWVIEAHNLPCIGDLFLTGKFNPERIVAITGSNITKPHYVRTTIGVRLKKLLNGILDDGNHRIISGNVLTGKGKSINSFLRYNDNQISVIPEGKNHRFLGWILPDFTRFSYLRAGFFTWLTPKKKYNLTANSNGEHRALVLTGKYEQVFPFNIYPLQLLKAIMVGDIDQMENLGIIEVAPEDFALPEFICVSKTNMQELIREGLDKVQEELM